ncbi:alpha/beta fold hydrolase [Rossellomorea aquimaris]|uniref:alpha/beta fold hydrolase n=1 Tax=Rossellomorea aquimaris TaxID=189382 RepID=UPI001CFE737D|nr:alpha/beta hydrolase [Rossellomorea aquimaris]
MKREPVINSLQIINNHKLEILQKGRSGPLIVILTGMGCSFEEWYEVTEELRKTTQVLMYHRPGLGDSELGAEVRNTFATVQDLYELLHFLKVKEPIYLVGHSYGGLCAQHFVKVHPEMVAGMVLVDSTSVNVRELDELDLPVLNEESDEKWVLKCLEYASKEKEQLTSIIQPSLLEKHKQFPVDIQERLISFQCNPSLYKAMASEIQNWKKDAEIIKKLNELTNTPLVVIGRDKEHSILSDSEADIPEWELRTFEEKWEELIIQQGNLSENSDVIFAEGAGHSIFLNRPDVVVDSVLKITGK